MGRRGRLTLSGRQCRRVSKVCCSDARSIITPALSSCASNTDWRKNWALKRRCLLHGCRRFAHIFFLAVIPAPCVCKSLFVFFPCIHVGILRYDVLQHIVSLTVLL